MSGIYSHSRAAVLCFGGWGLQTMLHLYPRLRATQDRRSALGAVGPDLTRITSLAAIMPEPLLDHNGNSLFHMRQLRQDGERGPDLDPFYIERLLTKIDASENGGVDRHSAGLLSTAERRSTALLRNSESVLQPLGYDPEFSGFRSAATGLTPGSFRLSQPSSDMRHATRDDMFHTALEHADPVARLLETHLIDPIREDSLAPNDPFVQTTLYVIAPLFEPLAAALIWPTVAQLMQRLGRRNISQVVGFFATGSYSRDTSRAPEDAAAYAALSELEVLTGLRGGNEGRSELSALIEGAGSPLVDQIGEALFDSIYLLDREKSNQGLAQDSHELTVLVGNALEALVSANGGLFVQEQVGIGLHGIEFRGGSKRPYSLIGAATDYVPLAETLRAVNRQEGRRLAHQWALQATQNELALQNPQKNPLTGSVTKLGEIYVSIFDLGLTEPVALASLTRRLPDLFQNPAPETIPQLIVDPEFVLSRTVISELRRTSIAAWNDAFETHLQEIEHVFDLAVGQVAVDEAWGLDRAGTKQPGSESTPKLYPSVAQRIRKQLLEILAVSPAGLPQARKQIADWMHEIAESRAGNVSTAQAVATATEQDLTQARDELARREWQTRYAQAVGNIPKWWQLLLGVLFATGLVAFFTTLYLLSVERAWEQPTDSIALGGLAVLISIGAALYYRQRLVQVRNLRRERVALARMDLTNRLRHQANQGLLRLYDKLIAEMQRLSNMLAEAEEELSRWNDEDGSLGESEADRVIPRTHITYLRQPKVNQLLWDRCAAYLRQLQEEHSQADAQRLAGLWDTHEWRNELQRLLDGDATNRLSRLKGQPRARSIADLIRLTVRRTMMPVNIEDDGEARTALVRELASKFSLEHLLWRNRSQAQEMNRFLRAMNVEAADLQQGPVVYSEIRSKHQYVETAWNRAKPTANYDVVDRLATRGTTVDFAAAAGDHNSDLTRSLLDEFNVKLLPTEDPFSITFVRTVHGLGLDDLDSMQRYRVELRFLSAEERALILLTSDPEDRIYRYQDADPRPFVEAFEPETE